MLYLNVVPAARPLLQRLNAISYDFRLRTTVTGTPSGFPPIYIVDIDEVSLEQEGRWPWSRRKLADLITKLHQAGAAVIALDITLPEPEENPVDLILQSDIDLEQNVTSFLNRIRPELDGDRLLAQTLRDKNVILGYLLHQNIPFRKGYIKPALIDADVDLKQLSSQIMQGYTANLVFLAKAATQNGFITVQPDEDGVVRRAKLVLEHDGQLISSLATEASKLYLGAHEETMTLRSALTGNVQTITHAVFAGQQIRTDASGQVLIPYLGQKGVFPYISAAKVLREQVTPDLTDAIVLVGTSAQALADLRTTPLQAVYPGVEIQATLIHALLNPEIIPYTPEWKEGASVLLLVLLSLIMILLFPLLRPLGLILASLMLSSNLIIFNLWLWLAPRINLDIVLPLLLILLTTAVFVLHRLLYEHNERQRIHNIFGQYVPVAHINRMLSERKISGMEGERREMSVLFSDIRNFTSISEHLTTQQLKQFLNHYLTPMTRIIFDHHGTIDKYIGDLVMAFWGAPLADDDHAQHAVRAALTMREKTRTMQEEFKTLGLTRTVSAGIGIHSGTMNVGDMGSSYRRAYTVLGDAVNLGSRLEGLTKKYNILILVSEKTMQQCRNIFFREIDYVQVKGRQEPVRVYEPLALENESANTQTSHTLLQLIKSHNQALQAYYGGDWQRANTLFSKLYQQFNDPLYTVYLERIEGHKLKPPTDWDGVYTHDDK